MDRKGFVAWQGEVSTTDPPPAIVLPRTRSVRFDARDRLGLPQEFVEVQGGITGFLGSGPVESEDESGRYRLQVPETERELEIHVIGDSTPPVTLHLDWPEQGDLDLGRIFLGES